MQINIQPIEKRAIREDGFLDVHSIFYTIQGEGPFCGTPAVFVRLAGCNLQCPFCDTEYIEGRHFMSPTEIIESIKELMPRLGLVVITGGEPFRQNLTRLLSMLIVRDYYVQIETNGTLPPSIFRYSDDIGSRKGAYIVCSPKTGKVNPMVSAQACCFKYVMAADDLGIDGIPITALGHKASPCLARPPKNYPTNRTYLQPMDAQNPEENQHNIEAVRDSCLKHGYILQLQIHKLIGVE